MDIGKIISSRRKELGLTLEEVGKSVGVGKSTVLKWESGYISNMRRDKIALLARVLKINPTELLCDEERKACDNSIVLSDREKAVIIAYRSDPNMQVAVDRLLGISESADAATHIIKIAARGDDFKEVALTDSDIERLKKEISDLPDVDKL